MTWSDSLEQIEQIVDFFERIHVCVRIRVWHSGKMESDLRWEGGRWVYGVQMLACAGVLYYRSLATPKVPTIDKAAVRFPVSFVAFHRKFLAVFLLASGLVPNPVPRALHLS